MAPARRHTAGSSLVTSDCITRQNEKTIRHGAKIRRAGATSPPVAAAFRSIKEVPWRIYSSTAASGGTNRPPSRANIVDGLQSGQLWAGKRLRLTRYWGRTGSRSWSATTTCWVCLRQSVCRKDLDRYRRDCVRGRRRRPYQSAATAADIPRLRAGLVWPLLTA